MSGTPSGGRTPRLNLTQIYQQVAASMRTQRRISCDRCDVSHDHMQRVFKPLLNQMAPDDLARLEQGLAGGSLEVSMIVPPSFVVHPHGDTDDDTAYKMHQWACGYPPEKHGDFLMPTLFDAHRNPFFFDPNTPIWFAMQVYDKDNEAHSAIIFSGTRRKKAIWVSLGGTQDAQGNTRLKLGKAHLKNKALHSGLFKWLEDRLLFVTTQQPEVQVSRFVLAANGEQLGTVPTLGGRERIEGDHRDGNTVHNCPWNLLAIRASVHARLGNQRAASALGSGGAAGAKASGGVPGAAQVSSQAPQFGDPLTLDSMARITSDLMTQSQKSAIDGGRPFDEVPKDVRDIALGSGLLPDEYKPSQGDPF